MLMIALLLIPLVGILLISANMYYHKTTAISTDDKKSVWSVIEQQPNGMSNYDFESYNKKEKFLSLSD